MSFQDTLPNGADLRKLSLDQLDFSEADLSGCDFREAVFVGGSLRNAHLKLARFDGADLREADLGELKLVDAKLFKGATISLNQDAELLGELGIMVAQYRRPLLKIMVSSAVGLNHFSDCPRLL